MSDCSTRASNFRPRCSYGIAACKTLLGASWGQAYSRLFADAGQPQRAATTKKVVLRLAGERCGKDSICTGKQGESVAVRRRYSILDPTNSGRTWLLIAEIPVMIFQLPVPAPLNPDTLPSFTNTNVASRLLRPVPPGPVHRAASLSHKVQIFFSSSCLVSCTRARRATGLLQHESPGYVKWYAPLPPPPSSLLRHKRTYKDEIQITIQP